METRVAGEVLKISESDQETALSPKQERSLKNVIPLISAQD